jgi:arginase
MPSAASTPRYVIVEAPSILGLRPSGVEHMSENLLGRGLARRIGAHRVERIEPPGYDAHRDSETRTLNAHAIAEWTPHLADVIERVIERGDFPVVLGGDCSIVLGSMLALRRHGRAGLLYIDGHADFYQPEVNPNGEAASMDLAFATGYGPSLLTSFEGRAPLVRSSDVVLFGFRDAAEQRAYGSQYPPPDLLAMDLGTIRAWGIESAARAAVEHVSRADLDGYFVHLDADVLDDAIMPAVDYRIAGGLSEDELAFTLGTALASGRVLGLELTIYNPELDHDGTAGELLARVLERTLAHPV